PLLTMSISFRSMLAALRVNGPMFRSVTPLEFFCSFMAAVIVQAPSRSHRRMVSEAGRAAKVRTLAIAYRFAPEHPYPAALDDAHSAWRFLRQAGIAAAHIAIGGDSAGGGLYGRTNRSIKGRRRPHMIHAWHLWNAHLEASGLRWLAPENLSEPPYNTL